MAQPIRDAVEAAITVIGTHTFQFGNLFESNFELDKLAPASFPVAIFVPPVEYGDSVADSGSLNNNSLIRVLFLDRVPQEVDANADQANEIIETQLIAARQFVQTFLTDPIVRDIDGPVAYESLFAFFDATLYGIAAELDTQLFLTQPGCVTP